MMCGADEGQGTYVCKKNELFVAVILKRCDKQLSKKYRCDKQLSKSNVSINNGLKQIQSNFIIFFWKVQEILKILFCACSITDHSILVSFYTHSHYILVLIAFSF